MFPWVAWKGSQQQDEAMKSGNHLYSILKYQLELFKITLYNNSGRYEVATIFLLCWVGPPLLHI